MFGQYSEVANDKVEENLEPETQGRHHLCMMENSAELYRTAQGTPQVVGSEQIFSLFYLKKEERVAFDLNMRYKKQRDLRFQIYNIYMADRTRLRHTEAKT